MRHVSEIMARLHHSIALDIEAGRKAHGVQMELPLEVGVEKLVSSGDAKDAGRLPSENNEVEDLPF